MPPNDAYWQRQHRIVHPDLAGATIIIAGLGTLGSWTAHALAHTGAHLLLFDDDTVGEENVGPQSYNPREIGGFKADALQVQLRGFRTTGFHVRFPGPLAAGPNAFNRGGPVFSAAAVISCVDTFAGRRAIAEWCHERSILFIDTRMGGQVGVVWPILGDVSYERYIAALPHDGEVPPLPCGEEGVAFLGMWVASRVVAVLNNHFRGQPLPQQVMWHVGENLDIGAREEVKPTSRSHSRRSTIANHRTPERE
jgi:hypothetical protein